MQSQAPDIIQLYVYVCMYVVAATHTRTHTPIHKNLLHRHHKTFDKQMMVITEMAHFTTCFWAHSLLFYLHNTIIHRQHFKHPRLIPQCGDHHFTSLFDSYMCLCVCRHVRCVGLCCVCHLFSLSLSLSLASALTHTTFLHERYYFWAFFGSQKTLPSATTPMMLGYVFMCVKWCLQSLFYCSLSHQLIRCRWQEMEIDIKVLPTNAMLFCHNRIGFFCTRTCFRQEIHVFQLQS